MKKSLLMKLGLLVGLTAGAGASAQVFNVHDIQHGYFYYGGYNATALAQGALSDPGNNIWNGFGNGGGPGSTDSYGGGRPNDSLLPGDPGNPYAWSSAPYFAHGPNLFSPANFSAANTGNATSAGALSPVTIPLMNYGFTTATTSGLDSGGSTRTEGALTIFSAAAVVNGGNPGAGTAANPEGVTVLSNVPPGTYDLYLYGANPDGTRGAEFIVDTGTPTNGVYQTTNPDGGQPTTFVLGGNYVVYNNVTPDADSTIHIDWYGVSNSISGLSGEGDFNGLQLVKSTPFPAAPVILQPLESAVFSQGATATLPGVARGNPLAVQWYQGGTAVPGQTNVSLTYPDSTLSESGSYYCIATNIYGAVTSSVASLTIVAAPSISAQSITTDTNEVLLYSGHNHFGMSVTANGDINHPWSFYWESNGVATAVTTVSPSAAGVGAASYLWANTTGSATYSCVVSNAYGTATTTNNIAVTTVPAPVSPYSSALLALDPVAYWPLDETTFGFTYDYVGGINGTPTATADFNVGQPGPTAGFGASSVAYAFDSTQSAVDVPSAYVNFTGPLTIILWVQPQPDTFATIVGKGDSSYRIDVDPGGLAHFSDDGPGDVIGGPNLDAGAWHLIVGTYNGGTDALYVDGNLVGSNVNGNALAGNAHDFYLGGAPDYTSRFFLGSLAQVALLTNALTAAQVEALFQAGQTPVFIAAEPTNASGFLGGEASFSVTATGGNPITYQWSGPAGPIAGATNATLVLTGLTENTSANDGPGIYYCTITDPYSTTNTPEDGSVELTVNSSSPYFVQDLPPTFYALIGSTVVLPTVEAGNPPITNQWFYSATSTTPNTPLRNGGRISGAASDTLVISDAQSSDAGYYQVFATNGVAPYSGSSQIAQLVVVPQLSFNTSGAGWVPNGGVANINNNVLTVTDGNGQEASSIFFNSPVYVGGFEASFTYTVTGSGSLGDGATFCLQNSPEGTSAVGGAGGSLGYTGIPDSVAFALDFYTAIPGGIEVVTGGANPNNGSYTRVTPISFLTGDPINVSLGYNGQTLAVSLVDTVTAGTFATNIVIGPIAQYVGSDTALIGFTGGDGDSASTQTFGNFTYLPEPLLTATSSGTNVLVTWPSAVGGYSLQEAPSLTSPTWTTVSRPYALSGSDNQVTVPATNGTLFFRLMLPQY